MRRILKKTAEENGIIYISTYDQTKSLRGKAKGVHYGAGRLKKVYRELFNKLLPLGAVSEEEIKQFKKNKKVPAPVKEKETQPVQKRAADEKELYPGQKQDIEDIWDDDGELDESKNSFNYLFENWRRYLVENEEEKVITFDFDDTLSLSHWGEEEDNWVHDGPHEMMIERVKNFISDPSVIVYVVTSRYEKHEAKALESPDQKSVREFLEEHNLNVEDVYFTNGQPKIETLLKLGSVMHHDDDPGDILDARENEIEAIVSDPYGDYERFEADELKQRKDKEEASI